MELIKRSITGALFVALLAGCIIAGGWFCLALLSVAAILTAIEFVNIINHGHDTQASKIWTALGAFLTVITAGIQNVADTYWSKKSAAVLVIVLVLIPVRELFKRHRSPIASSCVSIMGIIYTGIPFALLSLMAGVHDLLPLAFFIFIWCNDVGAYCIGSLMGKHKLFERVSPKKSWEGFIGGLLFSAASAVITAHIDKMPDMTWAHWIGMAITASLAGTLGDLTESLFKRELGIKDSGNILPGHGGMLDRFDSTLAAAPIVCVYLFLISGFAH